MKTNQLHQRFLQAEAAFTDTRNVVENGMFFALKGENFNGNLFAKKALENGAKFAVVDQKINEQDPRIIVVENVLKTLQALAAYHRKYLGMPIVALTGSNGKTTTKELIAAVLSKKYKILATQGNLNNHIGVPLTLLSMNEHTEIGVVEMGANHPKEIALLTEITQPNYGYITNFGKAHLEGFGGIEGVIKAKSELYDYLRTAQQYVFVNADDPIQQQQSEGIKKISIGEGEEVDYQVRFVAANPLVEVIFQQRKVHSQLIGKYNAKNIAAAIGIGLYFGMDPEAIKEAVENYLPQNNRSQILQRKSNTLILDAYNANPTSMEAALESFSLLDAKQKVVILGDMFEVGEHAFEEHKKIVELLRYYQFDTCFLCGKNFFETREEAPQILWLETIDALKEKLKNTTFEHTHFLIKGSRGMALESILESL